MTKELIGKLCGVVIAGLATGPQLASAAPENGFGFYLGAIGASEGGIGSKGLSIGFDAQFALNDRWSANPYLMLSAERDSDSLYRADGLAGLQLRRWVGDWFVGAHAFQHDRLVFVHGRVSQSAYGLAFGPVAGFEYASGWGAAIQVDAFETTNENGVWRHAVRVHLTRRWY